jgi:hypothetical protein
LRLLNAIRNAVKVSGEALGPGAAKAVLVR